MGLKAACILTLCLMVKSHGEVSGGFNPPRLCKTATSYLHSLLFFLAWTGTNVTFGVNEEY